MLSSNQRPLLLRILDLHDRTMRLLGLRRDRITPASVKQAASLLTGLGDFGPADYEEGLEVYCRSVEHDAGLDMAGRRVVQSYLRRVMANRLLLVDYKKQHPETFADSLVPPLLVIGLPRTGSTFLHRLLAQDPAAFGPPAWLVWRPLPLRSGPDRRRELCMRAVEGMHKLSPALDRKHYQSTDEPEECYHLLDPSFRGGGLTMLCSAWGYMDWVRAQDLRPAYRMYREFLQIMQQSAPGRRLTLKAPLHTPYLDCIVEEIPDVLLVQTHRDPVEVAGSLASLLYTMFGVSAPRQDPRRLGALAIDLMRWLFERSEAQRAQLGLRVVDVRYRDLVSDPVGTARRVHEAHGLPWDGTVEEAIASGAGARRQHKQGRHRYRLEDFGLSAPAVADAFADYTAKYLG